MTTETTTLERIEDVEAEINQKQAECARLKAEYNQALNKISALTDQRQTLILRMHRGERA